MSLPCWNMSKNGMVSRTGKYPEKRTYVYIIIYNIYNVGPGFPRSMS
jgi:hypothetical protein